MASRMDTVTDLHIALPDDLISGLDRIARERGLRRVQVIREAVADYLIRSEAERLADEMTAYAERMADHSAEFTMETDADAILRLLRETEW